MDTNRQFSRRARPQKSPAERHSRPEYPLLAKGGLLSARPADSGTKNRR
jgi:hypothetical protein